jgi:hypothetical protein
MIAVDIRHLPSPDAFVELHRVGMEMGKGVVVVTQRHLVWSRAILASDGNS